MKRLMIQMKFLIFVFGIFLGCSPTGPKIPTDGMPEILNHTPFPSIVARSSDDSGEFYTAILKITLKRYKDGKWKLDQNQEELAPTHLFTAECPNMPYAVKDYEAFRKQAEVYLRLEKQSASKKAFVSIGQNKREIKVNGQCQVVDMPSELALVPYPVDGTPITLDGVLPGKKIFKAEIPKDLIPFLYVRYYAGQVIPTPTRLDTIYLEPHSDRVVLTYRSTFPLSPAVRKVEIAAMLPEYLEPKGVVETDKMKLKDVLTKTHLRNCPVPEKPIEKCSDPKTPLTKEMFGL